MAIDERRREARKTRFFHIANRVRSPKMAGLLFFATLRRGAPRLLRIRGGGRDSPHVFAKQEGCVSGWLSVVWIVLAVLAAAGAVLGAFHARRRPLPRAEAVSRPASDVALKAAMLRTEAAEAQVRRGRNLLDTVASMARIGGWELDLATMTPIWSEEVYRIHELDPADRPDFQTALAFYPPEARATVERAILEALENGTPWDMTVPLVTRADRRIWVRIMGVADKANGVVTRLSGAMQDVTDRLETEQRLARAIAGSSDAFFEWDLTNLDRAWFSPRLAEILGYAPDELQPDAVRDLMWPEDQQRTEQALHRHFETGEPYDVLLQLPTRAGELRWFRARGRGERDDAGKPVRFSGSLQDITQQRQAEAARIAAKEAEAAASRAKGNFLANMSHEIRTPMNGVIGMTELLLDTPLQSQQREFAETIRGSATTLLGIINDILDFSKIEAGKLEIERVEMNVRDTVEDIGIQQASEAAARNLELIVNVDPGVPERVLGDPQRLRQILANLVSNAIKFTRQGEVVVEVFPIALQSGRALLSFEVRDTGIGMPPDVVERLFEPFSQGDVSSTRQHGGAGLGLAIVRRLVTLMGGRIDVSTRPEGGSIFTFAIPFDAIYDAAQPDSSRVSPKGKRVLVMDDNPTNRRVLCGQLQPSGFDVVSTATGSETMRVLSEAVDADVPFDVLIADDQMPDCSGMALAAQIRSQPRFSTMQLILLTSLDKDGSVRSLAEAGFAAYLTKPIRGRELRACVERVLARDTGSSSGRFQGLVTRSSLAADQGQGQYQGKVLVVEDNVVNQQVARRFLERLGLGVQIAENGQRAVDACSQDEFRLILMDVQMPVMDGLAAARAIRAHDGPNRAVPIIALTASAMTDELERCTAAGMNGLLAKPLEIGRLREILDRYGLRSDDTTAAAILAQGEGVASADLQALAAAAPAARPVDLEQLRTLIGDDRAFLQELCETFVASSSRIVEDLNRALASGDRPALSSLAHKLKGGSASVCAHHVAKLAAALEKDAKEERPLEELAQSVAALRKAFDEAAGYVHTEMAA
jgi:two-component system sensor histidine kinase/response regulator